MRLRLRQKAGKPLALAALMVWTTPCGQTAVGQTNTTPAARVTRCDLFSHGMPVGHGQIIRAPALRGGRPCTEIRLMMETRVNLLVYKFAMTMDETWVMAANELIAYAWDSTENGQRKTIAGELRDGIFHFEITENGKARVWTTPRKSFDVAAIDCQPGQTLADGETRNVRVLDPSTCTIAERTYLGTGKKTLTVGKSRILCDTVMIAYSGTRLQRWFTADAL